MNCASRFRALVLLGVGVACGIAAACGGPSTGASAPTAATAAPQAAAQPGADPPTYVSADLYRLQSVTDVQLSADGTRIAYLVQRTDQPGRPYTQVWTADVATGRSMRVGDQEGSHPRWSPDGSQLAYLGQNPGGQAALVGCRIDAPGESADDHDPSVREFGCKPPPHVERIRRCRAGSDNRDGRPADTAPYAANEH